MRLRLPFAVTIIVLADALALASPSPVIPEAGAAVRHSIEGFVTDAAIVWSVFVLLSIFVAALVGAARRLFPGRVPHTPVALPAHPRRKLVAEGRTDRALARP